MITISLCMIVRDEELTLERCLTGIRDIVDEIIIVDTGSVDRTKEIAAKFTAKIYDFTWIDDFAAARNYSFSMAQMDYILWLDADDVILEEDRQLLMELKQEIPPFFDVVMMKYNVGRDEKGYETDTFYRERLVNRSAGFKWCNPVHECIEFNGNILHTEICITHRKERGTSDRNLKILEKLIRQSSEISARDLYYYARELYINSRYEEAAEQYNRYLDSENTFENYAILACLDLADCYHRAQEWKKALRILIRSFEYGSMRAEILCYIGSLYLEKEEYLKAIGWYELALTLKKPDISWNTVLHDFWDFIPNIQLCYCYYRIGDMEEAQKYNEKAAQYKPDNPGVIFNRKLFSSLGYQGAAVTSKLK